MLFTRNRELLIKGSKLIFESLKRRTFPLITTLISNDSELYRRENRVKKEKKKQTIKFGDFQTRAINSELS